MLRFSKANGKLQKLSLVPGIASFLGNKRKVYSLDLLAGHTCPFSHECLSKVVAGKVVDGPHTKFRCYAASLEALYKAKFALDEHNTKIVQAAGNTADIFSLLHTSMPKNLGVCRIHSSGDFFNQAYFDAWIKLAESYPDRLFYAYTKNLKVWIKRKQDIPANFVLTASYGGKLDHMISENNLRWAKVIFSHHEACGLEIDNDDSHAADPTKAANNFALLLHGVQKQGTLASKALSELTRRKK